MSDPRQRGGALSASERSARSLADLLNHLVDTVHPSGRGPYSNEEIATGVREQGGEISATYVWQLRRGAKDNPTKRHLEALAAFFGVPVAYFFDSKAAAEVDAELETLRLMRDVQARKIGLRAVGLSDRSLRAVAEVLARVRELEGLSDDDQSER